MSAPAVRGAPDIKDLSKAKGESKWMPIFLDFIDKLRIQSKEIDAYDDKGAKLDLWGSQRIFLEQISEGMDRGVRTFFNLKSRQLGITTVSLTIDLFWLATHPGMQGVLVADCDKNRDLFRATLKMYHESLPLAFRGKRFKMIGDNSKFMSFSNGSRLTFLVAGKSKKAWGEGQGYTFAHVTEVASYGTSEGLNSFKESLAEVHPDRLFIYESTAHGKNHWYDMYQSGLEDRFTKKSFFIGWWSKEINSIPKSDPRFEIYGLAPPNGAEREKMDIVKREYGVTITMEQLAWYRAREADTSLSKADLDQNQPWIASEAFVTSGFSFFQTRKLSKLMDFIYDPSNGVQFQAYRFILGNEFHNSKMEQILEECDGSDIEMRVWEQPVEGAKYVIGCDPAYGRNDWKDRHSIQVFRCYADMMVQVAEYADNRVETYQAAWVLAYLAGCYQDSIINIELTGGPGRAIFKELDDKRREYRGDSRREIVMERNWESFLGSARYFLYHRPDSMGAGYAYHTEMTGRLKFQVLNQVRDAFMQDQLLIRSAPLVDEMMNVVQDGSTIEAPNSLKDDRVFALVMAVMAWKDWRQTELTSMGMTYQESQMINNEQGKPTQTMVRHIVHNFWKRQTDLLAEEQPDPITFMNERGFE